MGFLISDSYPFIHDLPLPDDIATISEFSIPKPPWVFKFTLDVMSGYPYVIEYTKEPSYDGNISISAFLGLVGLCTDVTLTYPAVYDLLPGDSAVVEVCDNSAVVLLTESITLIQPSYVPLSITLSGGDLSALEINPYTINAYIIRGSTKHLSCSFPYEIISAPSMEIKSITPPILPKPIPNETPIDVRYEISGTGIKRISNSFELAGFSAANELSSTETMQIDSANRTSNIYDATFAFTVTDPSFKLHSFKFLFGTYNSATEVDYRLDGTTIQKGTYPMGDWVEYKAPTPIPLSVGSHSIRLYNSPSYWYLYSTTVKPSVKGMTITSSTLYAMQMVYSISTSGVNGEKVITIGLDDSLDLGFYDLYVESKAVIDGFGEYSFETSLADALEVVDSFIPDPTMSELSLSNTGRYKGCETTVTVSVASLSDIISGDSIIVRLQNGNTVIHSNKTDLTEGQSNFSYNIPASAFIGLPVGSYTVMVTLERGGYATELQTTYAVVSSPTVYFRSISPDVIQLPISTALTLSCVLRVSGDSFNLIQGSVSVAGTALTANINKSNSAAYQDIAADFLCSNIAAGAYGISCNLTVTSNEYGAFLCQGQFEDKLSVLAPIPDAVVSGISLDYDGRYSGSEVPVTVTAGIGNIRIGDSLKILLFRDENVHYTNTTSLSGGETAYVHTIPKPTFEGLASGIYIIKATVERGGTTVSAETQYKVVAPPSANLASVTPDKIQLPLLTTQVVNVEIRVIGEGINNIIGTVGLSETSCQTSLNTQNQNIIAAFSINGDIEAKGYAVYADLTVTSQKYGSIVLSLFQDNAFRTLAPIVVQKPKHSGVLYLYNNFELVAIKKTYISMKWVRRFNRMGEFVLQLEKTDENIALLNTVNIITKEGEDEAGFIEDISISDKIEVKGSFLSKMLTYRIVNMVSENNLDLQTTVNQLVNANYISTTPSRVIANLRISDYSISSQSVPVNIQNGTILQLLEACNIGFKVLFNTKDSSFDFLLYDGKQSDAVFCENYKNISDQQYFNQTANSKNVCYVEGNEQTFEVGSAQGLERREAYVRAGKYDPMEYGNAYLKQNKPVKSLDLKVVNYEEPFMYKVDYDIGDVVTVISESYKVEMTRNIVEITEFWDKTGFHLYVIFGDIPKDILTELKDKDNRLETLEKEPYPISKDDFEGDIDELIKENIELIIPDIVDEVYDKIEFPPLPDYLSEDKLDKRITDIVEDKLKGFIPGGGTAEGHIILNHLPSQAEINTMPLDSIVLVYNENNPYNPTVSGGG